MPFILVLPANSSLPVTDLNHKPKQDLSSAQFQRTFKKLKKALKVRSSCKAIIKVVTSTRSELQYAQNVPQLYHAEEAILLDYHKEYHKTNIRITSALIVLEPCYNHRYSRKHNYIEFFQDNGRKLKEVTRKFIPIGDPVTPIFFLEQQPEVDKKSTTSSLFAAMSELEAKEALALRSGPSWGLPLKPVYGGRWQIHGQKYMDGEEIFKFLKEAARVKKFDEWNSEGCDQAVVDKVQALMTA